MDDLIANLKHHPFLVVLAMVTVTFAGVRILSPGASPSVARGAPEIQSAHESGGQWHRASTAYPWEDRVGRDPFAVIEAVAPEQATTAASPVEVGVPTTPNIVPEVPDFELTTIMQGKHAIAVINGRSVIDGMSIDHWIVLEIDEDQVKLERDGLCILLSVSGERHAEVPVE